MQIGMIRTLGLSLIWGRAFWNGCLRKQMSESSIWAAVMVR